MGVCTAMSALQLAGVVLTFLLTVIWLDMFWVRVPQELHKRDLAPSLRRRGLLNLFVAAGGAAAAVMLLVWVSACWA
jgi:hypothetical protein